jgi:hypothetical protein
MRDFREFEAGNNTEFKQKCHQKSAIVDLVTLTNGQKQMLFSD